MADATDHDPFRLLFECGPDAMWLLDPVRGVFVDCNAAAASMMRCDDRAQFVGRPPSEFAPECQPDGRTSVEAAHELIGRIEREGRLRFEWWARRLDGEVFPVEVSATAVRSRGRPLHFIVSRDMTARARLEADLRAAEERSRLLFEQSPLSIQLFRTDGSSRRVNAAWRALFRLTEADADAFNVFTDPQLEVAGVGGLVRQAFAGEVVRIPPVPYLVRHNGGGTDLCWIGALMFPVFDAAGTLAEVVCIHDDITERRQAEQTLRESQQMLASIADNVSEAIYRIQPGGQLAFVNDAYLRLFGFDSLEALNAIPRETLYVRAEDRRRLLHRLATEGGFRNAEIEFRRPDGSSFWGLTSSTAVRDPETGAVAWFDGVITDVTERRRADQAIRDLNATLEHRVAERTAELARTNERLVEEIADRRRGEATLHAVWQLSEAFHTAQDLDQLFARIHEVIGTLMPARNFYLALHDPVGDLVSFPYYSDEVSGPPPPRRFSNGLTEYVLRTARPLLARRDKVDELMRRGDHTPHGSLSAIWLGVPLLVRGRPLGVMAVQDYHHPEAFGEKEQQLLTFVAEQTALAIERKRGEQGRGRRDRTQRATWQILEAVHAAQDLPQLYDRLHQIVGELMPARNFYIVLHDPHRDVHFYAYHVDEVDPPPPPRKMISGLNAWVLNTGRPLLANRDSMMDPASPWHFVGGAPSAIWLGVPLRLGDTILGVMAVQDYRDPAAYAEEEQQILTFVAEQVALAIDRKRGEQALRESEAKHRALFEATSQAVALYADDGLLDANPGWHRLLGYPADQNTRGNPPWDFSAPVQPDGQSAEAAARRWIACAVEQGQARFEWTARRADGTNLATEVLLTPIELGGRRVLQAVVTDISQRKQFETELVRSLHRERDLGQLKSNFVAMVSHEFRTPLGIIISSAGLLEKYFDRLEPEERREHLVSIRANTRRMSELMEEVLLFGQVEAGKLAFEPKPLDLPAFSRRLLDELRSATNRRCPLDLEADGLPPRLALDERLLRHVLTNLIVNSVKYSAAGSPVTLAGSHDGATLTLEVRDRGAGIPEADQAKLFQAFQRGSNVGHIPGTGLGLVIVKRCVKLHGGAIDLHSRPGEGTTVTVRVPAPPAPP